MTPTTSRIRDGLNALSLRKRVTLLAGVIVGLVALLISAAALVTVRVALWHQVDANLLDRAYQMARSNPQLQVSLSQMRTEVLGAADIRMGVVDATNKRVISRMPPPAGRPELEVARGLEPESVRTVQGDDDTEYRVVAVPMPEASGAALVLAQEVERTQRVLALLTWVLGLVCTAGVLFAAWAGFEIARTGLRPVQHLTRATERIAQTGDLQPIPVQGTDELARLTSSFNQMLTALASARVRERRLIADAGHELRTPLTSLRTNLELLVQNDARNADDGAPALSDEDRRALLEDVRAQVSELSDLVTDLVELSRDDPPSTAREELDLAEVVNRSLERVRRRAPNAEFDVALNPWQVVGDQQALERAVLNLLDNAAKWSPEGGVVTVRLADGQLTIADQGPGISDEDLPHVFERFYRSTEARTMPGSGLGLAIVRQAVDRHGGVAYAGHTPGGGATFTIRLPGSPQG